MRSASCRASFRTAWRSSFLQAERKTRCSTRSTALTSATPLPAPSKRVSAWTPYARSSIRRATCRPMPERFRRRHRHRNQNGRRQASLLRHQLRSRSQTFSQRDAHGCFVPAARALRPTTRTHVVHRQHRPATFTRTSSTNSPRKEALPIPCAAATSAAFRPNLKPSDIFYGSFLANYPDHRQ